jgi:DNA-binding CsgD family transcriptional regulator
MATDVEESVIGLSRCVVRALAKWGCPRDVRQLLEDLKSQIGELDFERRSMNNGTWRHNEVEPRQKEYTMEPTKIVEAKSEVRAVEAPKVVDSDGDAEKFLRSLTIATQGRRCARLALAGLSNYAIASLLNITEASVKHQLETVFKSTGVSTRPQFFAIVFGYSTELATKLNDSDPLSETEIRRYAGAANRGSNREVELGI